MSESEFYMWRAVFAFAMADRDITPEEQKLLLDYRRGLVFSDAQLALMREDFSHPHDVSEFYDQITEPTHKQRFCAMARALAWSDGDFDAQEERILKRVSCLGCADEHLRASRQHPDLQAFYDRYARNGLSGFYYPPPVIEVEA